MCKDIDRLLAVALWVILNSLDLCVIVFCLKHIMNLNDCYKIGKVMNIFQF